MKFSERIGVVEPKILQTDDIDKTLRNRILNIITKYVSDHESEYLLDKMGEVVTHDDWSGKNKKKLISALEKCEWYILYEIIEYMYDYYYLSCQSCDACYECENSEECDMCSQDCSLEYIPQPDICNLDNVGPDNCDVSEDRAKFVISINSILEQEKSGYRLLNGLITKIVDEMEIESILQASSTQHESVNLHMKKAMIFYSDRVNPDYNNTIKEAISAVEAMCCTITGESGKNSSLGNALKTLEDKGTYIHPALKSAFSKLYGYASDESGVRHGSIDFTNILPEDAKFMLVACAAFINYLIEKNIK